jgi:hypothetical protein
VISQWSGSIQQFSSTSNILTAVTWLDGAPWGQTAVINTDGSSRVNPGPNPPACGAVAEGFHTGYIVASVNGGTVSAYSTCCHCMTIDG